MALKRNFQSMETFSMSSMTDVIFLLLIFFMVTSTIIFPSAIDVNLPQSSEQTSLKPITEVYIDADKNIYIVEDRNDSTYTLNTPVPVSVNELTLRLTAIQQKDSLRAVALYADSLVDYGNVVGILDLAAKRNLKMVLATRAKAVSPTEASPSANASDTPLPN